MIRKARVSLIAGLVAACAFASSASAAIVSYNDGTGEVTFSPGDVVTPVITGVIAAVGAAAALFVIAIGIRWLYRMVKTSK
jgi:hypothetical protein